MLRRCKHNGFPVLRDGGPPGPPPDHPAYHAYAHMHPAAPPGHHAPGAPPTTTTTPGPLPTSTMPSSMALSLAGAPAGPLAPRTPFAAGAGVGAGAVGVGLAGPGGASGGGFYPGSGGVAPGAPGSCCGLVTRGHLMALLQKVVLAGEWVWNQTVYRYLAR